MPKNRRRSEASKRQWRRLALANPQQPATPPPPPPSPWTWRDASTPWQSPPQKMAKLQIPVPADSSFSRYDSEQAVAFSRGEGGGGLAALHLQCPLCGHFSKSHAHLLGHTAATHPAQLDHMAVGRLGNMVVYQKTARLFHCTDCFYTTREFTKLYDHIISKHCMDAEKEGGGEGDGEKEGGGEKEVGGEGEVDEEKKGEGDGEKEGGEGEVDGEKEGGEEGEVDGEKEGGGEGEVDGEKEGGGEGEVDREKEGGREWEVDGVKEGGGEGEVYGEKEGGGEGEVDAEKEGGGEGEVDGEKEGGGGEGEVDGWDAGSEGGEKADKTGEEKEKDEGKDKRKRSSEGEEGEGNDEEGADHQPESGKPGGGGEGVLQFEGGGYRCLICGWKHKLKAVGINHVVRRHDIPKSYAAQAVKRDAAATPRPAQANGTEEEEANSELLKEEMEATAKVVRFITNRFVCLICGWKTKLKGFAISHVVRSHEVQRPYGCKDCKRCFFLPSHLQQHVRAQHRPGRYACPFCCFRSHFLGGFRRHCSRCNAREEEQEGDAGEEEQDAGGEEEEQEEGEH